MMERVWSEKELIQLINRVIDQRFHQILARHSAVDTQKMMHRIAEENTRLMHCYFGDELPQKEHASGYSQETMDAIVAERDDRIKKLEIYEKYANYVWGEVDKDRTPRRFQLWRKDNEKF